MIKGRRAASRSFLLAAVLLIIHLICHKAATRLLHTTPQHASATLLNKRGLPELLSRHKDVQFDSPSYLPYLSWYMNLHTTPARIFACVGLITWLGFLFAFVGIVASDFFCPNLSTLSAKLGLSESVVRSPNFSEAAKTDSVC